MVGTATSTARGQHVRWRPSIALLAIAACAVAGRFALVDQVMRHDEALTFTRYAGTLGAALTDYSAPNNHILHSVLVWASTGAFGGDPWAIRIPAAAFGVVLVLVVHWWVSSVRDGDAGLVAASLVAGSYYLVLYSVIARGYTMVAVAFVVMLELGRRLLVGEGSLSTWAAWVAAAALGLATIPVFIFPFLAVVGWMSLDLLARPRDREGFRHWKALAGAVAVAGTLGAAAYLPAAVVTGPGSILANDYVQSLDWAELRDAWADLTADVIDQLAYDGWVAVAFAPLAALALADRRSFHPTINPAWGLVAVFALVALRAWAPPTRTFLFVWPLLAALAGIGSSLFAPRLRGVIRRSWVIPVLSVALAAAMTVDVVASGYVLSARDAGTFRDGPEAASVLHELLTVDDRIVVESHPGPVLEYYLRRRGWSGPQLDHDYANAERLFVIVYHPRPQDLDGVLENVPRGEFTEPRLLTELAETSIYVMER